MKGSTTNLLRHTRRIVLPCVAAAALIVPTASQAMLRTPVGVQAADPVAGNGAGEFSPPPGATSLPEFSPPAGAILPPEFSPPRGVTPPDSSTRSGQVETTISQPEPGTVTQVRPTGPVAAPTVNDGFDLGDAGVGAAIMAGAGALLLAAMAFAVGRRRRLGASHS
jgi:hypothetical protein